MAGTARDDRPSVGSIVRSSRGHPAVSAVELNHDLPTVIAPRSPTAPSIEAAALRTHRACGSSLRRTARLREPKGWTDHRWSTHGTTWCRSTRWRVALASPGDPAQWRYVGKRSRSNRVGKRLRDWLNPCWRGSTTSTEAPKDDRTRNTILTVRQVGDVGPHSRKS
jgi:hypothetical protein